MSEFQEINNTISNVSGFKTIMERFSELPWPQRKVPCRLINPCTQTYEEIKKIMFDVDDGGKIKKLIIEHGVGDILPHNASVYLHYSCYLEGKKSPFDTSLIRSLHPRHYQMGGGYLFPGFEIAIQSMRESEVAQFLIHPDYGFGKLGCPPRIPGSVSIMVVIKVVSYIDCGDVTLSKQGDIEFRPFTEKLKYARSHNALAVDCYKHGRIKMAFHHFREAQYTLDEQRDSNLEELERQKFLLKSFINQMMCLSHPKYLKPKKLIEIATLAEKEIPEQLQNNGKFHYCLGVAHSHLQNFEAASESFKKAQMLSPFLPRLSKAVKFLQENAGKALQEEKVMWREAFNKLGYSPLPDKIQLESQHIQIMRRQTSEMLEKCLENDHFNSINLGFGFTKLERSILAEESEKLGLRCDSRLDNGKIYVLINKIKD